MRALARILRKKREHEGAIDFGDNEVKFELDEKGKPLRVIRKTAHRDDAHDRGVYAPR
jgi:exoribonuclease R